MATNENYEIPETGAVFTFGKSGFADNRQSHFFIRNDPVVEISCGDEHTAIVCKNGRVFLFGQNDYGQLGLGHTRTVTKPSCLKYLKPFHANHVACGKGHTVVSTQCRRIFSFGSNSDGQLGTGDLGDKAVPHMVIIKNFGESGISAVSAGCFHSACLTENGDLYMWGSNSDGQCGVDVDANILVPTKIELENPVVAISCGYYHSAFISEGNLYTFGEEDNGKLGYKKVTNSNLPRNVELDFVCTKVECGGSHTLILSDKGAVFGCGSNFSGQLGITINSAENYTPRPLDFPDNEDIVCMSAGESHSAFITKSGQLYTCGDGRYGKTCVEDTSTILTSPTLVKLFASFSCNFVNCGGCQTMVLANPSSLSVNSDNSSSPSNLMTLPPLKVNKLLNEDNTTAKEEPQDSSVNVQAEESISPAESPEKSDVPEAEEKPSPKEDAPHLDYVYVDIQEMKIESDKSENETEIGENISDSTVHTPNSNADNDADVVYKPEGRVKKIFSIFKGKKSLTEQDGSNTNEKADENSVKNDVKKVGNSQRSRACSII